MTSFSEYYTVRSDLNYIYVTQTVITFGRLLINKKKKKKTAFYRDISKFIIYLAPLLPVCFVTESVYPVFQFIYYHQLFG